MEVGLERLIDPRLAAFVEEARDFNAAAEGAKNPFQEVDPSTPAGLRAHRTGLSARPAPDGPPVEEVLAVVGDREVPVRVTHPRNGSPRGVYLEIHGGGFYMSWAARSDFSNRLLADDAGIAVVSVDYRLAPEDPWPAAPDDCETAALWLLEQAEARFGTAPLAIGGGSAGANLAMTTLLRLRDKGLVEPFLGAALQYAPSTSAVARRPLASSPTSTTCRHTSARSRTGRTPTSHRSTAISTTCRPRCSPSVRRIPCWRTAC